METKERNELIYACKEFHEGQLDSQKSPYWLHPYRVALAAEKFVDEISFEKVDLSEIRDQVFVVGLFHDVIEDVENSWDDLKELLDRDYPGAFDSVIRLTKLGGCNSKELYDYIEIRELLARSEALTYEEQIEILIESGDLVAMIVKLMDNEDNSLPWRSKRPSQLNTKYVKSMKMLREALERKFSEAAS